VINVGAIIIQFFSPVNIRDFYKRQKIPLPLVEINTIFVILSIRFVYFCLKRHFCSSDFDSASHTAMPRDMAAGSLFASIMQLS